MNMIVERVSPTDNDQLISVLERELAEKDQEIRQLRAYHDEMYRIVTNKDMTYSDRILWMVTLKNYPEEVLGLKSFQPNISRLRQESGISSDSATKFFASMQEAKAIKYTNKPQRDESNNFTSISIITPLAGHTQANTRSATLRIKQRAETTKRRIARKLIITPCENCGSDNIDEAYSAIVPVCKNCNHPMMSRQETVLAKNVRIIEEEIISLSHDFSEGKTTG